MTSSSHIAAGTIITAIIASLFSINIFQSIGYIITVAFFSIFPDIDHTHSILGRLLRPISSYLVRHYGHRTITHSLIFFIPLSIVIARFNKELALIIFLSLLVHSILDASTLNGVALFYPISKRTCVVPGNPDYRIKTGSRSEVLMVILFVIIGVMLKPLYAHGFWDTLRFKISPFEKITVNILESINNSFTVDFSFNGERQILNVVALSGDKKKLYCLDLYTDKVVELYDNSSLTTINSITNIGFADVEVINSSLLTDIYTSHHQIVITSDSPLSITYFSNGFNHEDNGYQFILWNSNIVSLISDRTDKKEKELIKYKRDLVLLNNSLNTYIYQYDELLIKKDNLLKMRASLNLNSNLYVYDEKLQIINTDIKNIKKLKEAAEDNSLNTSLLINQLTTELESLKPNITTQSINYKIILK
ncbi:metal-dependent hydrolase [Thiospirochaeta perfilievii]|uniref:metal-dependent hydrolase n=1 Tax=Thiospirochaeta perfilievii TaxID=252967 RepID=UPI0016597DAA|nr:metal-dependent hydrolase [Thiospirochaeta perfilievii]